MNYAVIDIGSNSVRLLISDGTTTKYKFSVITKLAKDMGKELVLQKENVEATFSAVSFFVNKAITEKADKIYAFATAAVRNAKNRNNFVDKFYNRFRFPLDVVDGEKEAILGLKGVLGDKEGGVIDIGGGSTETIVRNKDKIVYKKSLKNGCVTVTDKCGQNIKNATDFTDNFVKEFGTVPKADFYGIGGTITSVATLIQGLTVYDSDKVNGFVININDVNSLKKRLYALSVSEREKITGLQKGRAEVIGSGICILQSVMSHLQIDNITVSERDNLEGYLAEILLNEQKN